jgi:hypothetical protein
MLLKYRKFQVARIEEDRFVVQLLDDDNNILMTMEPEYIEVGETYIVDLGTHGVVQMNVSEV